MILLKMLLAAATALSNPSAANGFQCRTISSTFSIEESAGDFALTMTVVNSGTSDVFIPSDTMFYSTFIDSAVEAGTGVELAAQMPLVGSPPLPIRLGAGERKSSTTLLSRVFPALTASLARGDVVINLSQVLRSQGESCFRMRNQGWIRIRRSSAAIPATD